MPVDKLQERITKEILSPLRNPNEIEWKWEIMDPPETPAQHLPTEE